MGAQEKKKKKNTESTMASMTTRFRYLALKVKYTCDYCVKQLKSDAGIQSNKEITDVLWKSFNDKLTFLLWNKGEEMFPTLGAKGSLLVRKLPAADPRRVFIGDIVVFKNPEDSDDYLVRRLAAVEGYEMVSNDEKDEPFVLEKDECWVLADNETLKPKEAKDSRIFGPVPMTSIIGRVIYCLRNAVDHGPVLNSPISTANDSPVLQVELDVDELAKNHKG